MSKSKGEFLTINLLRTKGYDPIAYRFMCLNSHYRKVMVFSYDILDNTVKAYNKLKSKVNSLGNEIDSENTGIYMDEFKSAISDDLNTSLAVTILYDVLKSDLTNAQKRYLVNEFDKVLSLNLNSVDKKTLKEELEINNYIQDMIEKRNAAKKNKNFELADSIRDELLEKGIVLYDTREGTKYEVK